MLLAASDRAQAVWQNLLLLAYASTIAAIPMGDAVMFSFTVKKPLAIGVARAVFVSSLGATLAMVITFAVWLTIESIHPHLHIDHFFYQIIESRLKSGSFYRILLIFFAVESALMLMTAGIGGFLASITPFVGEQNQPRTQFSFSSLLMDVVLGLGTISPIQATLWCLIRCLERFRPVAQPTIQDRQERMMMMMNNQANGTMKSSRRVTFKAVSDESASSQRYSDASRSSSRQNLKSSTEDGSQSTTRAASGSSTSTLTPYLSRSETSPQTKPDMKTILPYYRTPSKDASPEPQGIRPIINTPTPARVNSHRRPISPAFRSGTDTIPPLGNSHVYKPSPIAKGPRPGPRSRYAWLKNSIHNHDDESSTEKGGPLIFSSPGSRSGGINKLTKPFARAPYRKVSFRESGEKLLAKPSSTTSADFNGLSNATPQETSGTSPYFYNQNSALDHTVPGAISQHGIRNEAELYGSESEANESDAVCDEWAETKSQLTEDDPDGDGRFGWDS